MECTREEILLIKKTKAWDCSECAKNSKNLEFPNFARFVILYMELQSSEKKNADLSTQNAELNACAQCVTENVAKLEKKLETAEDKNKDLEKELRKIKTKLRGVKTELRKVQKLADQNARNVKDLQEELDEKHQEITRLREGKSNELARVREEGNLQILALMKALQEKKHEVAAEKSEKCEQRQTDLPHHATNFCTDVDFHAAIPEHEHLAKKNIQPREDYRAQSSKLERGPEVFDHEKAIARHTLESGFWASDKVSSEDDHEGKCDIFL